MGFRGSRVQIPPSRSSKRKRRWRLARGAFSYLLLRCRLWCRFSVLRRGERYVAHLPLLAHDGEQRLGVGLLVTGEQRLRILPAARGRDVLERVVLSLGRPL